MPLPQPKLDDKTFDLLVTESVKLIPRYTPEWTDHNRHDPGLTIVELFAWLTEMQQFYLDHIAPQSHLKFLKLLGTKPSAAVPAQTEINFQPAVTSHAIPRGTKLTNTELVTDQIIFETESSLLVVPVKLKRVLSATARGLNDNTGANSWDGISYAVFGEDAEVNSRLYLGFDKPFPRRKEIALTFAMVEDYEVPRGKHDAEDSLPLPSALVTWEYYNDKGAWAPLEFGAALDALLSKSRNVDPDCFTGRDALLREAIKEPTFALLPADVRQQIVTRITEARSVCEIRRLLFEPQLLRSRGDHTLMFSQTGRLFFAAPKDMGRLAGLSLLEPDLYWLRATVREAGFELAPRLDAISINTIGAVQGNTISEVVSFASDEKAKQRIVVDNYLAVFEQKLVQVRERDGSWKIWEEQRNFKASGPNDPHYRVVHNRTRGTITIKFGDGEHGRIPPHGDDQIQVISYLQDFDEERKLGASNGLPNQSFPLERTNVQPESLRIQVREHVKPPLSTEETETLACLLKFTRTTSLKPPGKLEVTLSLTALAELCDVTVGEEIHGGLYYGEHEHARDFTVGHLKPHETWKETYQMDATGAGGTIGGKVSLTLANGCQPILNPSPISTIEISSDEQWRSRDWQQVADFDASGPNDPHFVFDPVSGVITFGDGINGDIPPAAPEINGDVEPNIFILSLRTCEGANGNVVLGTIKRFADEHLPHKLIGTSAQPISASGGQAAEAIDEAETRAREDLRTVYQAVTSADFEFLAINTPGLRVARAKAIVAAQPAAVTVVVLPFSTSAKPVPSRNFLLNVCRHLDRHRLVTTRIEVVAPNYVRVSVHATITIQAGFAVDGTRGEVIAALNRFLRPVAETGDRENHGWPFGRTVFKSEVFEVIEKVTGVDCVEAVSLAAEGAGAARDANGNITITPTSVVFSGDHQVDVLIADVTCRSVR